jgi:F420-0:gamma-glutamyl ligase-like protein
MFSGFDKTEASGGLVKLWKHYVWPRVLAAIILQKRYTIAV